MGRIVERLILTKDNRVRDRGTLAFVPIERRSHAPSSVRAA